MSHRRHAWRKENKAAKESQVNIKPQHKRDTTETKEVNGMITKRNKCMTILCRADALVGGKHCAKHKPKDKGKHKVCANVSCKNHAPKDSVFCGIHRPKTQSIKPSKVGCATGNVLVFTTPEGIEVYGGGSSRQGGWWVMNPLPDLAIGPSEIVKKGSKHKFPKGWLIDSIIEPAVPIVSLDFPDYGVPKDLGKVFWLSLVEDIYTHEVKRISCQCMGGHGRTGVQLCILAHYLLPDSQHKWKDAGELIDWVREKMCVHEVEARSQQDYIAKVCDIPVGEYKVGHSKWSGTSAYGGANWNYDGTQWSQLADEAEDFGDSDDEGDSVSKIHTAPQSNIDLDLEDMQGTGLPATQLKQLTGCDVFDRSDDDFIEEDDTVFECIQCDQREIWSDGLAPLDDIGAMACMECGGEMIDITDLPETQEDLRLWMAQQDASITQVDIKRQAEEE